MTKPAVTDHARRCLPRQDHDPSARAHDRDQTVAGGVGGEQGARTRVAVSLGGSHAADAMREADRCRVSWVCDSAELRMSEAVRHASGEHVPRREDWG